MSEQYFKVNVPALRLSKQRYAQPKEVGSIWPLTQLSLSSHSLERKIKDKWLEEVDEEEYKAYAAGPQHYQQYLLVKNGTIPAGIDLPKPRAPTIEEEEDEDTPPPPPEGVFEPSRDGMGILAYWNENKIEDSWGAYCPHCSNPEKDPKKGRHRSKSKLWACCKDKSEWGQTQVTA